MKSRLGNFSANSFDRVKGSVSRLSIFYDELKQTEMSEKVKMGLTDLIADAGGTLGLFLGLSFLSLIEFVEILVQYSFLFVKTYF